MILINNIFYYQLVLFAKLLVRRLVSASKIFLVIYSLKMFLKILIYNSVQLKFILAPDIAANITMTPTKREKPWEAETPSKRKRVRNI